MKKVLFLTYAFPPWASAGTARPTKFAKYLTDYSWEPIVVTVKEKYIRNVDNHLLKDVHNIKIHRTSCLFNLRKTTNNFISSDSFNNAPFRKKKKLKYFIMRLLRVIGRSLVIKLLIPDAVILWLPFALLKSLQICHKNKVDVIYATGGPFSLFLTAYLVNKFTHISYVLDFRDPWVKMETRMKYGLRAKFERVLERKVVENASRVISANEIMTEDFVKHYNYMGNSKFTTINNGYDPDDFDQLNLKKNSLNNNPSKVKITYTGSVYSANNRSPKNFLLAVKNLLNDYPEMKYLIQITFVGLIDTKWKNWIKTCKLSDIVLIQGYVLRSESIRFMKDSDILLNLNETKNQIGQKIFEYMVTGKPILALTPPDGACARIIKETNSGIAVPPDDIQEISDALYKLICDVRSGKQIRPKKKNILKYQRSVLTKQLAETFNQVAEEDRIHNYRKK